MNLIRLFCLLCVFALSAPVVPAAPDLPNPTFAPELVDGVGKWYLNFETLPGYHYIVEESQDLENWTPAPSGSFYGNGSTQRLYICDGPMWADTPSSGGGQIPGQGMWQLRNLYMKLEMQSGNNGLVQRLSRASYTPVGETEPLPAWDKALTLPLPAQTARFRYFPMLEWDDVATHTMYWVALQVVITDNPAPSESFATTIEEAEELNVFSHLESQLIGQLLAAEGPTQPPESHPHKFARVRRSEIDVNGNGLWDWWELLHGYNPFALPGQSGYCDPNADDDGDGFTNQEEANGSSGAMDPKDKESHPPPETYFVVATKKVSQYNDEATITANWLPESVSCISAQTPSQLAINLDSTAAAEFPSGPFDESLANASDKEKLEIASEYNFSFGNLAASIQSAKVWLVHKPIEDLPVARALISWFSPSVDGVEVEPAPEFQTASLEIAAGQLFSAPYYLKFSPGPMPTGNGPFSGAASIKLQPIEVMTPVSTVPDPTEPQFINKAGKVVAGCPQFAKMEFSLDVQHKLRAENDADAFWFVVNTKNGQEGAPNKDQSIKFKTVDDKNNVLRDETQAKLRWNINRNRYGSNAFLFVSDDVDDAENGEGRTVDDATILMKLGGSLNLTEVTIDGVSKPIDAKYVFRPTKTIKLNVRYAADTGITQPMMNAQILRAQERMAQVGIILEYDVNQPQIVFPLPTGEPPMPVSAIRQSQTEGLSSSMKRIIDTARSNTPGDGTSVPKGNIFIYCVKSIEYESASVVGQYLAARGLAINAKPKLPTNYWQCLFLSTPITFTLAHEIGHIVTNKGHYADGDPTYPPLNPDPWKLDHNLMNAGTAPKNEIGGTKRLYQLQYELVNPKTK